MTETPERTDHNLWPGLAYDDPHAARAWLESLGFQPGVVVPGETDGEIMHSEMLWPEGGRVMIASRAKRDATFVTPPGSGNVYVVCADPVAVHQRAQELGAELIRPLEKTDYGSHGFSVRDSEGNAWSFGTYAG